MGYSFSTSDCLHVSGCFCVFHSLETLTFVRRNLEQTLLTSAHASRANAPASSALQGLPVVLVHAFNPDLSEAGLQLLRDEALTLSER